MDSPNEVDTHPRDRVTELPSKLQSNQGVGRMKKSVSMNYAGPGGMDGALQTPKKKNTNKRKKKNKNKSVHEGKGIEAICFLDLKMFKIKQCSAGSNHNPKKCLNYHDFKRDRRRPMGTYSSEQCITMSKTGE